MFEKNKHPLLEKAKKYWKIIILMLIILFSGILFWIEINDLNGLGKFIWHLRFFNHFLVDGNNKFNWIGITSVLAIVSLTFNAWDRRRQFNADLISKNRISWLQDFKGIASAFTSNYQELVSLTPILLKTRVEFNEESNGYFSDKEKIKLLMKNEHDGTNEYNKLFKEVGRNLALLNINLYRKNEDCEETRLLKSAYQIVDSFAIISNLTDIEKINANQIANLPQLVKQVNENLKNFQEDSALYCKNEWERAKRAE